MTKEIKAFSYIRFSSKEQEKGSSFIRQTEDAEKWAKKNNTTLDKSLNLYDKGLSAYRGVHRTKGALKVFLELVKTGKIAEGSFLLIENVDRLSREAPMKALDTIRQIVESGITIVTLNDNWHFTEKSINGTELYMLIGQIMRAHDESTQKSNRISDAWERKRENAANGTKITKKCPAWLYLSDDRKEFIVIPERAKAIQQIFEYKIQGFGSGKIERLMNEDKDIWKPVAIRKNSLGNWRKSYINKILRNKEVYGEYQLHSAILDKETGLRERKPVGKPIDNYYPTIISKKLFEQVQTLIQKNSLAKGNGGGRTGKASNLFTHIAFCGLCGSTMHFVNKGNNWKYLRCDKSGRLKECIAKPVRYIEVEDLFLNHFDEIDINSLLPNDKQVDLEINEVKKQSVILLQEIDNLARKIKNGTDTLLNEDSSQIRKILSGKLSTLAKQKEQQENEYKIATNKLHELSTEKESIEETIKKMKELRQTLSEDVTKPEQILLRERLRNQIKLLVDYIEIYTNQSDKPTLGEQMFIETTGFKATRIYKSLHGIDIKLKNQSEIRRVTAVNYSENKENQDLPIASRLDRVPKYPNQRYKDSLK